MDKAYDHSKYEKEIYEKWEGAGVFKAQGDGKTYTILMPPPNANASLHAGHAMYTIDDIMARWKRMQGFRVEWIPGTDHAGFETQYVYEKNLAKEGKSRMDFDRQTLYDNVFKFVKDNSGLIFEQFRRLGFSANWEKSVFTLDPQVLNRVFETFKQMESEGKVYRDEYIVNYCTYCGTSLAELEVEHEDRVDPLFYVRYPLVDDKEKYVVVATTRPEPIWVDTHLAVNPKDKKNKGLIGKKVLNPLTGVEMEIIGDEFVDAEFGTGVVKLTPAHDAADFEVARRLNLPIVKAVDLRGKMEAGAGKFAGLKVAEARKQVVDELQNKGLMEKIDEKYEHNVIVCYKCKRVLEPMVVPNWFIRVAELKKPVIEAVKKNKVKFFPGKFKKQMLDWLNIMHDWPISRQIVWGIRIPVWYEVEPGCSNLWVSWINKEGKLEQNNVRHFLEKGTPLSDIENGLQRVQALTGTSAPKYKVSVEKPGENFLPETDTFDTWFSSGQWPLVTGVDLPTDFMGTLSDILKFWVSRMIMFSIYLGNEVPFKDIYLWSMVADAKGVKMSKSKGNVVNPITLVEKYGADALRMTLVYGVAPGGKIPLAEEKVKGMRNFANKVWNAARFVQSLADDNKNIDKAFEKHIKTIVSGTDKMIEKYRLGNAAEYLYDEFWHWFCDKQIELSKDDGVSKASLVFGLETFLKLLHPFMPFVTEACWQELGHKTLLATEKWPDEIATLLPAGRQVARNDKTKLICRHLF